MKSRKGRREQGEGSEPCDEAKEKSVGGRGGAGLRRMGNGNDKEFKSCSILASGQ